MADSDFDFMETLLKDYYDDMKRIEDFKISLHSKEVYKIKLQRRLDNTIVPPMDYDVALPGAINYDKVSVQSSNDGTSPQELGIIKYIDDLEKSLINVEDEIANIDLEITRLEAKNSLITNTIRHYPEDERRMFKLRYGDGRPFDKMSVEMNLAASSIYEKVYRRTMNLMQWLKIQNYKIAE